MITDRKFRWISSLLILLVASATVRLSESACSSGCNLALGSYYLPTDPSIQLNLTYISSLFSQTVNDVLPYDPAISNPDSITRGTRINVSLTTCDCLNGGAALGHTFDYTVLASDTYSIIASIYYSNLTTAAALQAENSYPITNIPLGARINVTVSCYCGDKAVSPDYGLFLTYPLQPGENLSSVAANFGFSGRESLLQSFNPGNNFSGGIVYIPVKDQLGSYRPLSTSSAGVSGGAIAGISVAAIAALVISICIYFGVYRRRKAKKTTLLTATYEDNSTQPSLGIPLQTRIAYEGTDLNMEKSVEFTYEELAKATNDFNLANKIGEGGFGVVYYAELRGEKAAIKKMDMEASKEFLAELKVLTRVHHLNLVRLIGFCIEGSLFLIYEFIENGNLSQHLRGRGRDPLPWAARVQIALDSARGLEYIHEHTVPVYIHRDIKSANILIDNKLRAKVADFGLTKLTEVGNVSVPTRLVGTFGYMPPEYAQYGDVSPKVDVYAFGVVLYELISAKEAIIKTGSVTESKGLVALFHNALNQPDLEEHLKKIVDPRLGDDYPMDSVFKMAQIAKACTEEDPDLRPTMRSVVVALMALSSSTGDWNVDHFYGNQTLVNLMSGR